VGSILPAMSWRMEVSRTCCAGGKLLLTLLRRRWHDLGVDPLRPHGIYPPWGFFICPRASRGPAALFPGDDDVGLFGRTLRPHRHPDREGLI
jgi:hypothetical protein